jgi:hypothetical protein
MSLLVLSTGVDIASAKECFRCQFPPIMEQFALLDIDSNIAALPDPQAKYEG